MNKRGRPRKGLEIRERASIRLEPSARLEIENRYGSLQEFIDSAMLIMGITNDQDKVLEQLSKELQK